MRSLHPERITRVLIRGTNWVGDAVMSIPALREIRRIFPGAHISLMVRPWVHDVYAAADFIDEIVIYDKSGEHRGWSGLRRMAGTLRERRFDLAILLQNAMEAAMIAFWARIPMRLGYACDGRAPLLTHAVRIDSQVRTVHQAYYYLGILSGAGLLPARLWERNNYRLDPIEIGVRESDVTVAREMLLARGIDRTHPIVGLNPGAAYGGAKRWPADRFAELANLLTRELGAKIVIFGAPGERQIAETVAAAVTPPSAVLAGQTTLGQLMAMIRDCDLFITNDSGPMHLAAALNVPQLAIFGSTSEIATGPLSPQATIIKNAVACNPCFLRECPTDFQCMLGITVPEVFAAARNKLEESAGDRKGNQ